VGLNPQTPSPDAYQVSAPRALALWSTAQSLLHSYAHSPRGQQMTALLKLSVAVFLVAVAAVAARGLS